ncbi:MAG: phosphoenolpyruvate synthase [Chloroflexi bacterium]|mgnify:CR=1 FL=1|nr:MAG: phosphoenolpyruvate synthase [Chloroflexota bacterium]
METDLKMIAWFDQLSKADIPLAGGKGANLGEMTRSQIPVPPGFVVTAYAYFRFLEEAKLTEKIRAYLTGLDARDSKTLEQAANQIKDLISQATMPAGIAEEIRQAYRSMGGGLVAVRSSATAEDLPEASFAGQQRTFLNVEGEDSVVAAVQGCWASLFEPRAIFYRVEQGFDHLQVGIAVPVQRMVQSEVSGVMFTVDPMSMDQGKIVIEAAYGLGETVVSGSVTPDLYIVDKGDMKILGKEIAKQEWQLVRNPASKDHEDSNIQQAIAEAEQDKQKLPDEDIIALAQIAKRIEDLYAFPQDIEWAKEGDKLYIVQARPVTTLKPREAAPPEEVEGVVILSGIPASPGIASGPVQVTLSASEIGKVKEGEVLVAPMTTPDFVPAMKRASAIVTDRGGRTCHAAIVSREMGIPCVVGTGEATTTLKSGQLITVDGTQGKVYEGLVARQAVSVPTYVETERVQTRTKVYVNLAEPELAERIAARNVDGVGLLRAEFMIASIGEHPRHMMSENRGHEFVDRLASGLETFARAFNPRPVVYRTTDFKTNEYRNLKGGEKYEAVEENPMIGYRGCSRYVREIDLFKLELDAVKRVRQGFSNLWIMIPFVRTPKEMADVRSILQSEGLAQSPEFKLWMMVEVPSNIILLDKFIDVGIDGISIGSNDLTQLTLGIDRDSPQLAEGFDERDEAVMLSLESAIKTANRRGITSSICGQAPSVYPEITTKLVEWGITSVSANPDAIEQTRHIIAEAEKKLASGAPV